jgi:hypothetical protein
MSKRVKNAKIIRLKSICFKKSINFDEKLDINRLKSIYFEKSINFDENHNGNRLKSIVLLQNRLKKNYFNKN